MGKISFKINEKSRFLLIFFYLCTFVNVLAILNFSLKAVKLLDIKYDFMSESFLSGLENVTYCVQSANTNLSTKAIVITNGMLKNWLVIIMN